MKKHQLILMGICLCIGLYAFKSKHGDDTFTHVNHLEISAARDGEKEFLKHADEALAVIEQSAGKLSIKGVAIVVYIPGDSVKTWISKMRIVGQMKKGTSNLLGVAYSKAAEMADTYQDSGSGVRPPMKGEYGYQGGVIKKVNGGYVCSIFSGGSPAQDKEVATGGAELLARHLDQK